MKKLKNQIEQQQKELNEALEELRQAELKSQLIVKSLIDRSNMFIIQHNI